MAYFNVNKEALRRETTYIPEMAAYEYRPRGFYEVEYPDIPYLEVVDYTEIVFNMYRIRRFLWKMNMLFGGIPIV